MTKWTENYQAISPEAHAEFGVVTGSGFGHVAHMSSIGIVAEEAAEVAADHPVVFFKDGESDRFRLSALLGLADGENLFVDSDGRWLGTQIPVGVRMLPFGILFGGDDESQRFRIDVNSPIVSKDGRERLFEGGEETSFLKKQRGFLEVLVDSTIQTEVFIEQLVNRNLLAEFMISVDGVSEKTQVIRDMYTINVDEFDDMSEQDVLEFHKLHYLGVIYAIQQSLTQFRRLIQLRDNRYPQQTISVTVHVQGAGEE